MSYSYLLCFQESRFWPYTCGQGQLISTYAGREDPVCVHWASGDHLRESHGFCIGNKSTLSSSILFVWRLRIKTWRTMRGFSTRLAKTRNDFTCLLAKWSQGLSCSSLWMESLKSFCVWNWSLLIWDQGNRTSWDKPGGHFLQKQIHSLWYCSPPACLLKNCWKWFGSGQLHKCMLDFRLG